MPASARLALALTPVILSGLMQVLPLSANCALADSALSAQLDAFQADIDKKRLSEGDFQKLSQLAAANPTDARVHLVFGRAYDSLGLVDEAVDQYRLADKYGPRDPEAVAAILHDTINKGGGEAANVLLNEAEKRFPDDPQILYMIGKRLKEQKHYVQAGNIMIKAYKINSKIPGLSADLAELLINKEPGKAIYLARQELLNNAESASGLVALSKGLMSVGNYNAALPGLAKLFGQAPENIETTHMYLRALYWSGDFKHALLPSLYFLKTESEAAIAETPSALTTANICAHLSPQYVDATLQEFYNRTTLDKKPPLPPFHFFMGRIFFREHRMAEAKVELNKYLAADPKSAETLWMLGRIAETYDHDYQTALSDYRLAHAILPYNSQIEGAANSLGDKLAEGHNDWAWAFREWVYKLFSGKF